MAMKPIRLSDELAANDSWNYAEFTLKKNRIDLIDQYNEIAGMPSYAMGVLQEEFIQDRMSPSETISFVKVCRGLIAVALISGNFPD